MNVTRVCEHTFLDDGLSDASVVVDLGCNQGEFAHTVIDRYGCRVYAAEPVVALCERIRPSDRLRIERVALGGRIGSETVNIFAGRCASTLAPRGAENLSGSQDTDVITLDAFFGRCGLKSVDLMKVDIEGAEICMFEAAAAERLKQIGQITVEFHDFLYPKLWPKVEAVKRRLESLGFYRVNFSLDNTDVLFLNRSSIGLSAIQRARLKYATKWLRGLDRRFRRDGQATQRNEHGDQ